MEPTLNENLTYPDVSPWTFDYTKHNPWRAPGYAPVESPCGMAGGWRTADVPGNFPFGPKGSSIGDDGRDLPETAPTVWQAGSQQEVGFQIIANHGGGYAYRLCPASKNLTEECFQKHHLQFAGNESWIRYVNGNSSTAIPAQRVTEGTYPSGSMWSRIPIPSCSGVWGGSRMHAGCEKPQFEPPMDSPGLENVAADGLYGFGHGRCSGNPGEECSRDEFNFWKERFNFEVVDLVEIPKDLPVGRYVLSFRSDGEQTPQIWNSCSDIQIVSGASVRTALRGGKSGQ